MLDSAAVQALRDIKSLFDDGILTDEEYTNMKAEILTGARSPEPAPDAVPLAQSMAALRVAGPYECVDTLIGHSDTARLRRPAERSLGSSFAVPERPAHLPPSRAQVTCVAVLPDGRVVSGSCDESLKVWQTS